MNVYNSNLYKKYSTGISDQHKECAWCKTTILAKRNKKYCSKACRKLGTYQRPKKHSKIKNCKTCGKEFRVNSASHLYCTETCRASRRSALQKAKKTPPAKITLRWKVLNRDGFRCQYCGRNPTQNRVKLHVDHIKPEADGGKFELENLVTTCRDCNLGKSTHPLRREAEFRARLHRK